MALTAISDIYVTFTLPSCVYILTCVLMTVAL